MRRLLLVALVAACTVEAACKRGDPSAPAEAGPTAQASASASAPSTSSVTLLDKGGEPRAPVRYAPKKGAEEKLLLSMASKTIGGEKSPPANVPIVVTLEEVESGRIKHALKVQKLVLLDDPQVKPAELAALRLTVASLTDLPGYGVVGEHGVVREASFDLPQGTSPPARKMLETLRPWLAQLAVPLPTEPIGAGARWQIQTVHVAHGITYRQVATHELVGRKGDLVDVRSSYVQTASPQTFVSPELATDPKIELASFAGTGSGKWSLDLARLTPLRASIAVNEKLTGTRGGKPLDVVNDVTLEMEAK